MIGFLISAALASSASRTLEKDVLDQLSRDRSARLEIIKEVEQPHEAILTYTISFKDGISMTSFKSKATYTNSSGRWVLVKVEPLSKNLEFSTGTVIEVP